MKHVFNDGGRSRYTNVESKHDCVVRAVAIAANVPYIEAYAKLRAIDPGLESDGVNVRGAAFVAYMTSLGFVRVTGVTTMQDIPHGRVIAGTENHYTAIIDGTIQDVRNESSKAVSHYWVKGKTFDAYYEGKKVNLYPMNAVQVVTFTRLSRTNYNKVVHLKSATV